MEVLFANKNLPGITYMHTLNYLLPKKISADLDQDIKREALFNEVWEMFQTGIRNEVERAVAHNALDDPPQYQTVDDYEAFIYRKYYDNYDLRKTDAKHIRSMLNEPSFLKRKTSETPFTEYFYNMKTRKYDKITSTPDIDYVTKFLQDTLEVFSEITENEALDDMNEEYLRWAQENPSEAQAERYDYLV